MSQSPRLISEDSDNFGTKRNFTKLSVSEGYARTMVGGESDNDSNTDNSSSSGGDQAAMQIKERQGLDMKLEVKRVFGTPGQKCKCCLTWQDTYPEQDVEAQAAEEERKQREQYSILHKQMIHGGDTTWRTHSIEINNPNICTFISQFLNDSPGEKFSKSKIKLKPPYMALFYKFRQIQETLEKKNNSKLTAACRLLFDILLEDWKPFAKDLEEFQSSGLIAFQSIWTLFPPGELAVFTISNEIAVGRVCNTMMSAVEVEAIDHTGSGCAYITFERSIAQFDGLRKVNCLEVYPLQYNEERVTLKKRLIERGREFENLKGRHVKYYKGGEYGSDTVGHDT